MEPKLLFCTQRIAIGDFGEDEIHIECRFDDGQKFAAIIVDGDFPDLADRIATMLNREAERERT